ncbi:uncharacterized protein LOC125033271 [Penaeus chinensis]|uniref:uncharacterized protein LOC125033271 n=1 Tax=Penaeus chinensis TaxID=139456 RepID=UPI001FB66163|nr:uncharacterized protein LOC125033271 [Penaeus chinensis]
MDVLKQIHRKYNMYHKYSTIPLLILLPSAVILIADPRRPQELKTAHDTGSSRNLALCHRTFSLHRRNRLSPSSRGESPAGTGVRRPSSLTSDEYLSMGRSLHRSLREDAVKNNLSSPFSEKNEENILRPFMGKYPFIPCTLRHYDAISFGTCLSRRLREKPSLDLFFIGDSKIRNIFGSFLNTTRAMDYNISFMKEAETIKQLIELPWDQFQATQDEKTIHQADQTATSTIHPGLRVSFRFAQFWSRQQFRGSEERRLLLAWINGSLPPPDLVIIGYGSWTLYAPQYLMLPLSNLDILHILLRTHQVVGPLLQKLSRKTLVLFHAETRQRPRAMGKTPSSGKLFSRLAMFSDSLYDWSEMMLRYFLEKRSRDELWDKLLLPGRENLDGEDAEGVWWWDSTLPYHFASVLECNDLHRRNLSHREEYLDPRNNCQDQIHAGANTRYLEVTMLLNLLCNSHVVHEDHFCCS